MDRRCFLRTACLAAAGTAVYPAVCYGREADGRYVRRAMFYEKREGGYVQCRLCPWACRVGPGRRGRCDNRENREGDYYTLVFGRAAALNNDPIEKKPFYHFRPGEMVLSAATAGCNIACKFCQNWQLSQSSPEEVRAEYLPPERLVRLAVENGIPNIAFTYNEPTVAYEYMYETARAAREAEVNAVVVSNGFISPAAVEKIAPHLAAYKIDLKAFTEDFYRRYCAGRLSPVLRSLKAVREAGLWLEIVNLILPTANDDPDDIRRMAGWIGENLGRDTPLHFTRFHPMYKIRNLPPTPAATLEKLCVAAEEEGLRFVYLGNLPGHPRGNTVCPDCGEAVIRRTGMWSVNSRLEDGCCPECGAAVPGVWA